MAVPPDSCETLDSGGFTSSARTSKLRLHSNPRSASTGAKPADNVKLVCAFEEPVAVGGYTTYSARGARASRCTGSLPEARSAGGRWQHPNGRSTLAGRSRVAYMRRRGAVDLCHYRLRRLNLRVLGSVYARPTAAHTAPTTALLVLIATRAVDSTRRTWRTIRKGTDAASWTCSRPTTRLLRPSRRT